MSEKILIKVDPDLEALIPGFLENRGKDVQLLRDALTRGAITEVKTIGHNLKGVGGGYGFERITEIGAGLENAAERNDSPAIAELIATLEQYLESVEVIYQ